MIDKLRDRKDYIEQILENFGADSTERVEDLIEELDDIKITIKTLKRYG